MENAPLDHDHLRRDSAGMDSEGGGSMRGGTVRLKTRDLVRLRTLKGWSQEILAERASYGEKRYDVRTIQRAECGAPVFLRTLRDIALALGVEARQLVASEASAGEGGR